MTKEKIISVLEFYQKVLDALHESPPRKRIDPKKKFSELSREEILSHANFLIDGAKEFALQEGKLGKANRHLSSIQMCLSFAGLFSLEDVMNHNKPGDEDLFLEYIKTPR